jgi:hypothetical protein
MTADVAPVVVTMAPDGLAVTVYLVIALPPVGGAVHVTVAWPVPAVATTFVGAPGTESGVTETEGIDTTPVPTLFVAVTVKV